MTLSAAAYHSTTATNLGPANFLGEYTGAGFGLGVENLSAPQHAVDNNGGYDFIVFKLPAGTNFNDLEISFLSPVRHYRGCEMPASFTERQRLRWE